MTKIWTAIAPSPKGTRIIATRGPGETILKATLRTDPRHHRALPTLLEALALWEGTAVRGALIADEHSTTCDTSLFRDLYADLEGAPLFTLDVVWGRHKLPGRDGLGDFRDLRRVLAKEVAR